MNRRQLLDSLSQRLLKRFAEDEAAAPGYDHASAALEARLMVQKCTGESATALLSDDSAAIESKTIAAIEEMAAARLAGRPMAYLLGEQEFYSLTFSVNPYVLIPRPETELLVERALAIGEDDQPVRVLEPGTGSGCVAIAIARSRPGWRIEATDRFRSTLDVARANGQRHNITNVRWRLNSWLDDIDDQYDIIASNPPYIAADQEILNALRYEPLAALYGGPDGMSAINELIDNARNCLRAKGWLLLEIGADQADAAMARARGKGLAEVSVAKDLAGRPRLLCARRA